MSRRGNGAHGAKECVEQSRQLDVRELQRSGLLGVGMNYGWSWSRNGARVATIRLTVDSDQVQVRCSRCLRNGQWHDAFFDIPLERTPCHLGGERVWWRCPEPGCGRRVALLYGGSRIACRHCNDLAYRCQRESAEDRAARRANKIRRKLGWSYGILNLPGDKPKGMHWKTFARMQAAHNKHSHVALALMANSLGLMQDKLKRMS